MAWTTPGTAVAGDVLTAARWNSDVRDNTTAVRAAQVNVKSSTVTNITTSTSTTSFTDITGLSVTITPSSATSLILVSFNIYVSSSTGQDAWLQVLRGATAVGSGTGATNNSIGMYGSSAWGTSPGNTMVCLSNSYLDSPATTSATTYKLQWRVSGATVYLNRRAGDTAYSASSSITVMEVPV